jgi:deoxyhypusine synthase
MASKKDYLREPVRHVDMTRHNVVPLVESMRSMAYSARDLARAAEIYDRMLADRDCAVILCLAGSLISAGLKKVFVEMIRSNMADAIVSTGANIVDQDFFEGLGFRHYIADERLKAGLDDSNLLEFNIDRIYDTLIDEQELRICDDTVTEIADSLDPRPYSSREILIELGAYLEREGCKADESIILEAYRKQVPIFCPAFSDCSAGFGLLAHQYRRGDRAKVSIDSVKDFLELAVWKHRQKETGLFMIGGGVPKNFAQDVAVAADVLGEETRMHKYAVQVTVADVRDGALSSSTLKEANSWGKVDTTFEQMVYSEATVAVPLMVGYAYHKGHWKSRSARQGNQVLDAIPTQ